LAIPSQDLQRSCQDLEGSLRILGRTMKILAKILKILEDPQRPLKILTRIFEDLDKEFCKIPKNIGKDLAQLVKILQ